MLLLIESFLVSMFDGPWCRMRDAGPKPIPAKKKDFIDTTVNGWQRIIHPEGALYYYNATRVCPAVLDFDR